MIEVTKTRTISASKVGVNLEKWWTLFSYIENVFHVIVVVGARKTFKGCAVGSWSLTWAGTMRLRLLWRPEVNAKSREDDCI